MGGVASRLEPLANGAVRTGSLSPTDGLRDTGGVGDADSSTAEGATRREKRDVIN